MLWFDYPQALRRGHFYAILHYGGDEEKSLNPEEF